MLPAAAAECTPDPTETICGDQVRLVMHPTRSLVAHSRIADVAATPLLTPSKQPPKMLAESVRFSGESSTMRWLYSTVAEKRIFAIYTGPKRGLPAELRITVRLSLL